MKKHLKTSHKYPGIPAAVIMMYMSCSGILLNHPELISGIDAPAALLPPDMRISDWGRGAAQCFISLDDGTILAGGKTGIFALDPRTGSVIRKNIGLPPGVARREVKALARIGDTLFAGTPAGLFRAEIPALGWRHDALHESVIALCTAGSELRVFSNHSVYRRHAGTWTLHRITASETRGAPRSPVQTLFALHSGKILGLPGRLFIDLVAALLFVLSASGLILTVAPAFGSSVKKRIMKACRPVIRYHLTHHKRWGWVLLIPMIILPLTGLFMRPPFIAVFVPQPPARSAVLREMPVPKSISAVAFDASNGRYLVADANRIYALDSASEGLPRPLTGVLPAGPMGIMALVSHTADSLLIGDFAGLAWYSFADSSLTDVSTGAPRPRSRMVRRTGPWQVRSLARLGATIVVDDFRRGPRFLDKSSVLSPMPRWVSTISTFSLWSWLFEVHNGRILRSFFPKGYTLHNPIVAIVSILAIVTGILLVMRNPKKQKRIREHGISKG